MTKTKRPAGYYSKAAHEARAVARAKRSARVLTDHQQARRAAKSAKFFAKQALAAAAQGDEKETRRLAVVAERKNNIWRCVAAVLNVRAARFRIERAIAA